MSSTVRGVVVCHAALASSLVEAVEAIVGPTADLVPISNSGCGREAIASRVEAALDGRPTVVFVDLPGGSCHAASIRLRRDHSEIQVVGGVNLPMLLDFVMKRTGSVEEIAARVADAGRRAVTISGS